MAVKKTSQIEKKPAGRPRKSKTETLPNTGEPIANRDAGSMESRVAERVEEEIRQLTERIENSEAGPDMQVDVDRIADAIRNVDTSIEEDDGLKEISGEINKALRPVQELTEKVSAINMTQEAIDAAVAQSPEKAEELIRGELSRAAALKDEISKMMGVNAASGMTGKSSTRWWNGMSII